MGRAACTAAVLVTAATLAGAAGPAGASGGDAAALAQGFKLVDGRPVIVELALRDGADAADAERALRAHGAEPLREEPPRTFACLFLCVTWPQFAEPPRMKHPVEQHYNASGEPPGLDVTGALAAAQRTWTEVPTSAFGVTQVGTTDRCPSLLCGQGGFDGHNDVGWLALDEATLGIAVIGFDVATNAIVESDIALNRAAGPWRTDGTDGAQVDVETVLLHELGHLAGLGHVMDAASIMFPFAIGVRRDLGERDIEGISYLYPNAGRPHPGRPIPPAPPIRAKVLATIGDAAPGGGALDFSFVPGELNDAGIGVTAADLLRDDVAGAGVYRHGADGLAALAESGRLLPSGAALGDGTLGRPGITDGDDAVFQFLVGPLRLPFGLGGGAFRAPAAGGLEPLVLAGTAGPAGAPLLGVREADVSDRGAVAFSGITATSAGIGGVRGVGVYRLLADGAIAAVAVPGDAVPGAPSGPPPPPPPGAPPPPPGTPPAQTFDYAGLPSVNDAGDVAFEAHRRGTPCRRQLQVLQCREAEVYVRRAAGLVEHLAGPETLTPEGDELRHARAPVMNDAGQVLFLGAVGDPTLPEFLFPLVSDGALFVHGPGGLRTVARPNDPLPGGSHLRNVGLPGLAGARWAINDAGDVAFAAALTGPNPEEPEILPGLVANGVYLERRGRLSLVARSGTEVLGLGTIRIIGALHIDPADPIDGSTIAPGGVALNDAGDVVFPATLTDGRIVLLRVRPH